MIKHLFSLCFALTLIANSGAAPSTPETPPPAIPPATPIASPDPTWETQKHARTYVLGIPGPRGQIVDRDGNPDGNGNSDRHRHAERDVDGDAYRDGDRDIDPDGDTFADRNGHSRTTSQPEPRPSFKALQESRRC